MIRYTDVEREFLKKFIPGHTYKEIQEAFSAKYRPITYAQASAFCKNNHINTGMGRVWQKGHPAWNKGIHMETKGRMAETQFKAGNLPHNYKPIGTERISKDGYIEVKVADPRTWEQKHRIIWREHHGDIPDGYIVMFKDGNKANLDIDNLALISRNTAVRMNQIGLSHCDPEFFETAVMIAKILEICGEKKCKKKESR